MPDPDHPADPDTPEATPDDAPDDAPEATPEAADGDAQRRVLSTLTSPGRSQFVVALLLGLLGFAAVTQVRINQTDDDYSGLRQQELIDVLDALAGARQRTQEEIDRLEGVRDDLRSDTNRRRAALKQAESDVDDLNILAGRVPVTGPGVRITITETTGRVQLDSILDVIQELRAVDAEAIQVNGVARVVAQTAIAETTGGFLIDGVAVKPPYTVEAIGEPAALGGALDTRVGAGSGLVEDGADVEVDELSSLDITAVRDADEPQYADPDDGQ